MPKLSRPTSHPSRWLARVPRVLAALAIVTTFGLAPAAAQTGQTFGDTRTQT